MLEPVLAALLAVTAGISVTLEVALPEEIAGWKAEGSTGRYDAETIFDYIDGHGEIYLAYGMKSCSARLFKGPADEGEILLDVFAMGSAGNAYGIFTHARDGEPVAVGQGGSFGAGTLAFWKGSTFVSITAERSTERSRAAVLLLGRSIAAGIPSPGSLPALVGLLPGSGLDEHSVVHLRHPIILSAHLDVGAGNPLGVGPEAPAALGRYRRQGGQGWVLLVEHRSEEAAEAARKATAATLGGKGDATLRGESWWAVSRRPHAPGRTIVVAVRASSKELAETLLGEALHSAGGSR